MIVRVITLVAGILSGATASQFPEFSQQYTQRLGGAVDALGEVVADFDASAAAAGLDRGAALEQMQGTAFLDSRRADMSRTFLRYDRLREDLTVLESAGPFMRAYHATRMTDSDVARAAMDTFEPAVPLGMAGLVFAGTGFFAGVLAIWVAIRLLVWPFRRRRNAAA